MSVEEVTVEEAVRDLLSRYTWCSEFLMIEEFGNLWTATAQLEIKNGASYNGREEIVGMITGQEVTGGAKKSAASSPMRHHVSSIRIEVHDLSFVNAHSYFAVHTHASWTGSLGSLHGQHCV